MKHTLGTLRLTQDDLQSAAEIIDDNWLSPGPKVADFEKAFSSVHCQKYGHMVNSGTDALRVGLAALKERYGWKDGQKVIVPAITFVATVNVVLQLNLIPVLADVSMYDFNLNPDNLFRRFFEDNANTGRTDIKAVIPVHLAGTPCDMKALLRLARTYQLKILEDSCEAMGVDGIGLGDITAFSFYVAHILTTGVGGMAVTNDKALSRLMWSYINHGRREAKKFVFDRIGYSCRPTEFEAALGLNQLPLLDAILERRQAHSKYLATHLDDFSESLYTRHFPQSACMFFPILVNDNQNFTKWDLMEHLEKRGIESRELMPLTHQPCYKGLFTGRYPIAEAVNERGFYIGCHQDMNKDHLDEILEAFTEFLWGKQRGVRHYGTSLPTSLSRPKTHQRQAARHRRSVHHARHQSPTPETTGQTIQKRA